MTKADKLQFMKHPVHPTFADKDRQCWHCGVDILAINDMRTVTDKGYMCSACYRIAVSNNYANRIVELERENKEMTEKLKNPRVEIVVEYRYLSIRQYIKHLLGI